MGYTTDFEGAFKLNRKLLPTHAAYLHAFNKTRRMKRDASKLLSASLNGPIGLETTRNLHRVVGLPLGEDACYWVGAAGMYGQDRDESITEYNSPPRGQPGLWCQWRPTKDGRGIEWDGGEKFYDYVEWLKYLIVNFLKPWGYELSGCVNYQGEERGDFGMFTVCGHDVTLHEGVRADVALNAPPCERA